MMQRRMEEKVAWIKWAKRILGDRSWSKEGVLEEVAPQANNQYIRAWVNTMEGSGILWLIKERIPIFITHPLTNYK
jgi:hypothetical protein